MAPPITANTKLVGLIGHPVGHSLSPAMHNAAYAAMGLDAAFTAFAVAPDKVGDAVRSIPALGLVGLAVTVPHKQSVRELLDDLSPSASSVGAVNWIASDSGRLTGHNTDGVGFMRSLEDAAVSVEGRTVAVVGAGGSARSIAFALNNAGAQVCIAARRSEVAAALATEFGGLAVGIGDIENADVVVNCTPVGMSGGSQPADMAVPTEVLHGDQVVVDIVYAPETTPLLRAAQAVGAKTVGGLGMLAHQAAEQIRLWSGEVPPLDVMIAAAREEQARQHADR